MLVRDLRGGGTYALSSSATLPTLALSPVEWATRTTAWSQSGSDLYFVDQPDVCVIRRYRAGALSAEPPLAKAPPDKIYLRDLHMSSETGRLGYLSYSSTGTTVHELDPVKQTVRDIATFTREGRAQGIIGRGWLGRDFVLVRSTRIHEDFTADLEVLLADDTGRVKAVGRITHAFAPTIRLHASRRVLYVTRAGQGTHNAYAFSLDTGHLTVLTQNALPGVTFSGFQPAGLHAVIGVREERREDVWLIQQTATPRTGNPAGR